MDRTMAGMTEEPLTTATLTRTAAAPLAPDETDEDSPDDVDMDGGDSDDDDDDLGHLPGDSLPGNDPTEF